MQYGARPDNIWLKELRGEGVSGTYCGRDCFNCYYRGAEDCPGCKRGPGGKWSGMCEIAGCCRNWGLDSCVGCRNADGCARRMERNDMPERRKRETSERREKMETSAGALSFGLTLLFALLILRLASAFFAGYSAGGMPWLNAGAVCGAVYGAALCWLGIRVKAEGYKLAGVMSLLALVMNALNSLIAEASFVNAVILGAAIAAQLYGEYGECRSHAGLLGMLGGVYAVYGERWRGLWRRLLAAYAAVFVSGLAAVPAPEVGRPALIAASAAMMIFNVQKLVYLWRAAKAFSSLEKAQ